LLIFVAAFAAADDAAVDVALASLLTALDLPDPSP
jgi:hypothetical protein